MFDREKINRLKKQQSDWEEKTGARLAKTPERKKEFTTISEIPVKKANRQTSAAGYTISFGRGTVIKRKFRLSGRYTAAEKAAAITFLDTHQGAVFIFNS